MPDHDLNQEADNQDVPKKLPEDVHHTGDVEALHRHFDEALHLQIVPDSELQEEFSALLTQLKQQPWGQEYLRYLEDPLVTRDPGTSAPVTDLQKRILYAYKWAVDFPCYSRLVQEERVRLGERPRSEAELLRDFEKIRPVPVMLRGTTYRRYAMQTIGAGKFKKAEKQLYVSKDMEYIAVDLAPDKNTNQMTRTMRGDDVTYLDHEMFMYAHLRTLFGSESAMRRYFLHFYGKSVDEERRTSYMSLELAKGFHGHNDLLELLEYLEDMQVFGDTLDSEESMEHVMELQQLALGFLADAVRALDFLHRHNIAYNDFKPENIFLHVDSEGPHAKLADFGGAMHLTNPDLALEHHHLTPGYYSSPMVDAIDLGDVDPRHTDLYALRKTLELLQELDILPEELFLRMMALPWDRMDDEAYADGLLSALLSLLESP